MSWIKKLTEIRNFSSKTVVVGFGCYFAFKTLNKHIDNDLAWTWKDTAMIGISFLFAVGASYFNSVVDVILGFLKKIAGIKVPKNEGEE